MSAAIHFTIKLFFRPRLIIKYCNPAVDVRACAQMVWLQIHGVISRLVKVFPIIVCGLLSCNSCLLWRPVKLTWSLVGKVDNVNVFPLLPFAELYYDRGNHHEFVSLVKDLARPGEITQSQTFDFEFTHVEKPYESYTGQNVKLR